jgi:CheY-like chemotaxis protein
VKTVLIVDDELGLTEALQDVLGDEGFHVHIARNGRDGLKRAGEQRPDVIVLDYMMPVLDGPGMLLALQSEPTLRDVPVLLISAVPRTSLPADCTPTAFLRKPFALDVLLRELRRLVGPAAP